MNQTVQDLQANLKDIFKGNFEATYDEYRKEVKVTYNFNKDNNKQLPIVLLDLNKNNVNRLKPILYFHKFIDYAHEEVQDGGVKFFNIIYYFLKHNDYINQDALTTRVYLTLLNKDTKEVLGERTLIGGVLSNLYVDVPSTNTADFIEQGINYLEKATHLQLQDNAPHFLDRVFLSDSSIKKPLEDKDVSYQLTVIINNNLIEEDMMSEQHLKDWLRPSIFKFYDINNPKFEYKSNNKSDKYKEVDNELLTNIHNLYELNETKFVV